MPPEIWEAMKKLILGVSTALIITLVIAAYARMEQVPENANEIERIKHDVQDVKVEVQELRQAVDRGNRAVVVEIRKLGKRIAGQNGDDNE